MGGWTAGQREATQSEAMHHLLVARGGGGGGGIGEGVGPPNLAGPTQGQPLSLTLSGSNGSSLRPACCAVRLGGGGAGRMIVITYVWCKVYCDHTAQTSLDSRGR